MSDDVGKSGKTDILEWIKVGVAVVGFGATIITYIVQRMDTQETEARTRTLAQIDEYTKGKVFESKKFVDNYWVTVVPEIVRNAKGLTSSDIIQTLELTAQVDEQSRQSYLKFKDDVAAVINHFDYISFCGVRGVCDEELIAGFYCKEYDAFQPAALPTLEYYKANNIRNGQAASGYFGEKCDGPQPRATPLIAKAN
jgi:hypothetical protein